MSVEKRSWIEVVNGDLKGSIALPSGAIEIVGVKWHDGGDDVFRLFEAGNLDGEDVGVCWNWAGNMRRSIMIATADGRYYGRLEIVEQVGSRVRFSIETLDDVEV